MVFSQKNIIGRKENKKFLGITWQKLKTIFSTILYSVLCALLELIQKLKGNSKKPDEGLFEKIFTKFVNSQKIPYLCIQIRKNMVVEYEKDYLEELYNDGKCTNKKYRFQKPVVAKYQRRIDTLTAATRIEDLFVFNSLNFEALENGYYSIRIDYHYRLEFKIRQEGPEPVVTICTVTDITNHYQ